MNALWESEIRFFFASAVLIAGLALIARGSRQSLWALGLPSLANSKNLLLMRGFRLAILGLALSALALGWLIQSVGLAAAAAIIGAGELMETSVDIRRCDERPRSVARGPLFAFTKIGNSKPRFPLLRLS